jgi:hypothetical protein
VYFCTEKKIKDNKNLRKEKIMVTFGILFVVAVVFAEAVIMSKKIDLGNK